MELESFVGLVAGELAVDPTGWTASARFVDDLGFDSLALLELFLVLESVAGRVLPEELLDSIETVEDAWAWSVRPLEVVS